MNLPIRLIILITLCAHTLFAQTTPNTIRGAIRNEKGEALPGVNVGLSGTTFGAATDANGQYTLNAPDGRYTLVVSAIGFDTQRKDLSLTGGQTLSLNFALTEITAQLQTIEIFGRKENDYKSDYSYAATKVEARSVDVPQSISTITKELIQDQNIYRLNETVKNVAGVNQFSVYDDITMRGFRNSDYRLINGMRSVANFWSSPLLVNIERVEFIKGPSSALFSNSNPGGTINMVTKKPLNVRKSALDFSVGSFNTIRTTADFTGPMDDNEKILYRLNLGYENAGSFRDNIHFNTLAVAPSITFLASEKTTVNFDMSYTDYNTVLDRGRPTFQNDQNLLSTPIHFNLNQPGDMLRDRIFYGMLSVNHKLSNHLSLNASYMKFIDNQTLKEHGFDSYITRDSVGLYYDERLRDHVADNFSGYLTATFRTGELSHQALAGFDYIYYFDKNSEWWSDASSVGGFSLTNPQYVNRNTSRYVPIIDEWSSYETQYHTMGAYFQDLIRWKKLQVLLGFRWDRYVVPNNSWEFKDSGLSGADVQEALLPRIGLVYSIRPNTNIYGTFNQGYQPVDPFSNANPRFGGPFLPMYSQLLEGGIKSENFGKRLLTTLAVYQIEMNNVLVNANNPGNPDQLTQRGQERARGVELEAVGKVTDNLSILANYAFNNAVITRSDDEQLLGLVKENAPQHVSSTWVKYRFTHGALKGIGLAIGHSQVSERRTFARYTDRDEYLMLPAYTVFNGALSYAVDKFSLSVNVNNLTNQTHWIGGYNFQRNFPGAPRNFMVRVAYNL
jgi:iron complex outermembrane recepter protein